ncbi:MAG: hypothetical protein IIY21_10945 [Clostridiales bacterium]|nr:hypothetical protein [Clostridiales bacterium]MBQ1571175.1 hypothetical protein [Clostridiales bacterium]
MMTKFVYYLVTPNPNRKYGYLIDLIDREKEDLHDYYKTIEEARKNQKPGQHIIKATWCDNGIYEFISTWEVTR